MADQKLSVLTEQTTPTTAHDELYIRDVSETTAADQSKMTTLITLMGRIVCMGDAVVCLDNEVVII